MIHYLIADTEGFDPETVSILGAALDSAWEKARANQTANNSDGKLHKRCAEASGFDSNARLGRTGHKERTTCGGVS
jgi:hypothetical protein